MGQYYKPVSLDRMEYVLTHDYDSGLKLMEHSYIGNPVLNVVESLLSNGGDWYKNRIVWAGDYADEGKFVPEIKPMWTEDGQPFMSNEISLYRYASYEGKQIEPKSPTVRTPCQFLCNWDKKEYVNLAAVKPIGASGWEAKNYIHPLSLLTADGNGRGGGDYRNDNDEMVGAWAGDRISMEQEAPEDFTELIHHFEEV